VSLANYLFELGQLKRVRRSGWWCAGIDDPESVAEHSFSTAAIAWVLAELEGANPDRAATLAVFHDTAETRVNDQHRLGRRYLDTADSESCAKSSAEQRVVDDQCAQLPEAIGAKLRDLCGEATAKETPESRIAKDADLLECFVQAIEYRARGYDTREWIDNCIASFRTESARKIALECRDADPNHWWKHRDASS